MPPLPDTEAVILAVIVSAAAVLDLNTRRLPNWLTFGALTLGLLLAAWDGHFANAMKGVALALAIYVPLFALRTMGGGDVKLMAAVGAFAGFRAWPYIFILTAVIGGVVALTLVVRTGATSRTIRNVGLFLTELGHGRIPSRTYPQLAVGAPQALTLPHGVSIAFGVLSYLVLSGTGQ